MIKLSTIKQDEKVLRLRRKGLIWKEVAAKLLLSVDQAKHAERRLVARLTSRILPVDFPKSTR